MLNLINQLFAANKLVVYGVAEAHPASMLNTALETIGAQFDDSLEDGPIDTDYLEKMAGNKRVELNYWNFWKRFVSEFARDPRLRQFALEKVEQAESISLEERRMVETCRPKTLYMEGCAEYPSSVIGFVAKNRGATVVYLDKGFQPYIDWQKSRFKTDLSYVQNGRERYWVRQVKENKPRGTSLLIAGRNHLIRPSQSVLSKPSHAYIGNFPTLLRENGISFEMYADLSRQEMTQGAMRKAYAV